MLYFIIFITLVLIILISISKVSSSKSIMLEVPFDYPRRVVFNELCEMLSIGCNNMKLTKVQDNNCLIIAKAQMSIWSWGETVFIQVVEIDGHSCKLKIGSKSHMAVYDYGKNKENINNLVMQLKLRLKHIAK